MQFNQFLQRKEYAQWKTQFESALAQRTDPARHGDLTSWLDTLAKLPKANPSQIDLNQNAIVIGKRSDLSNLEHQQLKQCLQELIPWRKGPYNLFDIHVDCEWRSDWKWQRLIPHISKLQGRRILDVGCGNGYHCWRMLGAGAKTVLGIDPSMRFLIQHQAINAYAQQDNFDLLPLGIEDMPIDMPLFDSVFSMGVLYHRRNPVNHLTELKNLLQTNGELVLETLIIDQADDALNTGLLATNSRYAKMRNVWSIMTVNKILNLLSDVGFKDVRCVDQNITSTQEQRSTEWMHFHSLRDFLDPLDISKTIEGYPAPKRAIFIAQK